MKRFAISVLSISVFFVGLGSLAKQVGAKFKSDEKALEIVAKSRAALGGEAALAQVRSMVITGRSIHQFKIDGAERSETGETEIAIQFPDKLSKSVKIGNTDAIANKGVVKKHDVIVTTDGGPQKVRIEGEAGEFTTADGKRIVIRKADGAGAEFTGPDGKAFVITTTPGADGEFVTEDGKRVVIRTSEVSDGVMTAKGADGKSITVARAAHPAAAKRSNELVRLALSLLLTAPEGMPVSYRFAGESDVDGVPVNIVAAAAAGSTYKLYIGKSTNLPVAVSYVGAPEPVVMRFAKDGASPEDMARDNVVFTRKIDAAAPVETLVRLADYRTAGTVLLPYKWTTSTGGNVREIFEVSSFDINPANIAERFANQHVLVKTKKADGQ
ncbi:MAG TPA: hypothetical protein PKD26_09210 [Pyrinomonadaceae bacterium]|nr:hypothetical protein [Pyrinomonadaceae bacterium]